MRKKVTPEVSAYFRALVLKRNKKYGKKWLSANNKKARAIQLAKKV